MQNEKEIQGIIYLIARQSFGPLREIQDNALVYSTFCGNPIFSLFLEEILRKYKSVEVLIFYIYTHKDPQQKLFYLRFDSGRICSRVEFNIELVEKKIYIQEEDQKW